jgi:hypothetical protein
MIKTKHEILTEHIEAVNAKTGCGFVTDPAHWDNKIYQIDTPAKFDHWLQCETLFEVIEFVDGYKPNWRDLKSMTTEQLTAAIDSAYARQKKV